MPEQLRVLIVGASIAGHATAYWLAKTGASITIIERYPQFRKGGQNVNIRSTAVKVMRKIPGMEQAVKARPVPLVGFEMLDGYNNNQSLGKVEMSTNPEQQSLLSQYEIFRDSLSEVLYDLTKHDPNINYIYNEQVTQMVPSSDGGPVKVDFMNGHPSAVYNNVVAL
jgi:2-polyprenyl-6-methoxyphenol hydroxylase-like FAD-dependent oxidoreductase